ncbi:MAG: cupin domain-containing protein [Desulfobulbaceae bacterium]|nr:MAG: cupin domain-containing protein [Desulfobulbaceae bacterium]
MKHCRLPLAVMLLLLTCGHAQARENQAAAVRELVRSEHSWDGAPLPAYPAGQPEITILDITIPPGAKLPVHQHPDINAGVLIKGVLTVVTREGKTLQLRAGDPIVEVVGTWHYGINEGTTPAEIIVFYAGKTGSPLSIKETD